MKLLYVTTSLPWPCRDGGAIRVWHQACGLAGLGHAVTLLSPPAEAPLPGGIPFSLEILPPATGRRNLLHAFRRNIPWLHGPSWSPEREATVLAAGRDADLVLLDGLDAFAILPTRMAHKSLIDFVDECGLRYDERARAAQSPLRREVLRFHARSLRRGEARALRELRGGWITTGADLQRLSRLGDTSGVEVVPNGVDPALLEIERRPADGPVLLFVGALGYPPNTDAIEFLAREILPIVRRTVPDAVLQIVGRGPVPETIRSLESQHVRLAVDAPSLMTFYETATVSVIPMRRGTGIQNKLLEALAAGVPVVTTPRCLESLPFEPGTHLLAGESAEDLAAAILELLGHASRAGGLQSAAREAIRSTWTLDIMARRLEHFLALTAR